MSLTLEHFSLHFKRQPPFFYDLNLNVASGGCVGILGANGAGKSTLIKAISQDIPYQGKILWQHQNLSQYSFNELALHRVVLPQASTLNFNFSVREIIEMGLMMHNLSQVQSRALIEQVVHIFDLVQLVDKNYLPLSGGEKQRVHAARVWVQVLGSAHPKLILLDEPTSALDLKHQHQLLQQAQQLAQQQHLVLVIMHDLNLAARYCQRLLMIHQGRLLAYGNTNEVLIAENIATLYGYHAKVVSVDGIIQVW